MQKKSVAVALMAYVLWGVLPIYWRYLARLDPLFVLANRIIWAAVTTFLMLVVTKKARALLELFKDWSRLKYIIPAAIVITLNWGVYIWAVGVGRVIDSSLGYFMNPLAVAVCGMVMFKERVSKLEGAALLLALAGVALTTAQYGGFPFVAVTLAVTFASYGTLKKFAHTDGLVSVCAETIIVAPIALAYVIFAPGSASSLSGITALETVLCVAAGFVTAMPLVFYTYGVTRLPFITMGFLQYIAPTMMLIIGILQGEPFTSSQGVSFGFIWAGLALFTIGMVKRTKNKELIIENEGIA